MTQGGIAVQGHTRFRIGGFRMLGRVSQIKMVESVFVVIIFMVILAIGIVFFSRFQESDTQFRETERQLTESIQLAQTFASLPEISCTEGSVISDNCIDMMKLDAMHNLSKADNIYYYDLFRYGRITVERLYPSDTDERQRWVIYNRTKPGAGYFSMALPMTIYDAETGDQHFGVMEVVYYDD
ncbi:MAG: hypothetical protein ACLFSL_04485 [Candidatus Woesearchaeota archaeon]